MKTDLRRVMAVAVFLALGMSVCFAGQPRKGEVNVKVSPSHAYIWVDGKPFNWGSRILRLEPGNHTIMVQNYGYEPMTQQVTVESGVRQTIEARLNPSGPKVKGPWGRIQIEGAPDDALVFMNGTTPGFFVGHAGELNNNFLVTQTLIMPVGSHNLYIVDRKTGKTIWSGVVNVEENKRLVVYLQGEPGSKNARMVYKDWKNGEKRNAMKRFDAGFVAVKIAVPPVTAHLATTTPKILCDQTGKLNWTSENAAQTVLTGNGQNLASAPSGNLDVQPRETTNYQLRAAGPGGVVTQDATVNVDPTVTTSISVSQPELRFEKEGSTIKTQDTANLSWSASNASSVQIDRIGAVSGNSGTQTITATPSNMNEGEVNETQVYKITAKNNCGGSATKEVAVHISGTIAPEVVAEVTPPPELPHTATPLPLLALFGLATLGAGAVMRLRSRR